MGARTPEKKIGLHQNIPKIHKTKDSDAIFVTSVACLSVCLSVCPLAYLKNTMSRPNFTNFLYMLPSLTVARFFSDDSTRSDAYFHFVMFSHSGANRSKSSTTLCFIEFASWRILDRSQMSMIALFMRWLDNLRKLAQSHLPTKRICDSAVQSQSLVL